MRCLRAVTFFAGALWLVSAALPGRAQQAPPAQPAQDGAAAPLDPQDEKNRPLTPEEEREKQIRQADPLALPDDTDQNAGQKQSNQSQQQPAPLPNSIAASEQEAAGRGPRVVEDEDTQPSQQYTGPAVLSRSYSLNRPLIPQQLKWQESLGLNAFYDSGLIAASTDQKGAINDTSSFGDQFTWSILGRHYWKKDQLGLDFKGNIATASQSNVAGGSNFTLSGDFAHTFTRRLSLQGSVTASKFSQNYALDNAAVAPDTTVANINLSTSPVIQIFDNGMKQLNTTLALVWQESARLSFSFGGSYFAVVRDSRALLGMTGQQANTDINYRLTRKTTIGGYYSFSDYLYAHGFGQSDTHTVGGIYSYALTRSTQIRLRAGVARTESLGLETVPILNPLIAALLGQTGGIIDAYNARTGTDISAQVVHDFRGSRTANVAYAKAISPGNGVYQASEQQSVSAGFNATVRRQYNLSVGGGYSTLSSVSQTIGKYTTDYGTVSVSRNFHRGIAALLSYNFRHYSIYDAPGAGNEHRISTGITWGNTNGRLWPF
jgi:hypothetical protein